MATTVIRETVGIAFQRDLVNFLPSFQLEFHQMTSTLVEIAFSLMALLPEPPHHATSFNQPGATWKLETCYLRFTFLYYSLFYICRYLLGFRALAVLGLASTGPEARPLVPQTWMAKNLFPFARKQSPTFSSIALSHLRPCGSIVRVRYLSSQKGKNPDRSLSRKATSTKPKTRAASLSFLESQSRHRPSFRDYPNLPGRAQRRSRGESRSNHNPDSNVFGLGTVLKQLPLLSATFFFLCYCLPFFLQKPSGKLRKRSTSFKRTPPPLSPLPCHHFSSKKGFDDGNGDGGWDSDLGFRERTGDYKICV